MVNRRSPKKSSRRSARKPVRRSARKPVRRSARKPVRRSLKGGMYCRGSPAASFCKQAGPSFCP